MDSRVEKGAARLDSVRETLVVSRDVGIMVRDSRGGDKSFPYKIERRASCPYLFSVNYEGRNEALRAGFVRVGLLVGAFN